MRVVSSLYMLPHARKKSLFSLYATTSQKEENEFLIYIIFMLNERIMSPYLCTMLIIGTCIVRHVCKITYTPYGIKYTVCSSQLRHTYQSLTTTRKCMLVRRGLTVKLFVGLNVFIYCL